MREVTSRSTGWRLAVTRSAASAIRKAPSDRNEGRATFVPLAAPGERVRARLEREKGRVAWAELVAIERPSADRVAPACPLFGACGGCQWQHVSIEAQREAKRRIVERALAIADHRRCVPAGPAFGYRDRAKLTVGSGGRLGFHARRSHEIVDVPPRARCWDPSWPGRCRRCARWPAASPRASRSTCRPAQKGYTSTSRSADATSTAHVRREIDRLEAAGVVGLSLAAKSALGRAEIDVAEPGSAPLAIPAGGFAQVGRAANAALVAAVRRRSAGHRAWSASSTPAAETSPASFFGWRPRCTPPTATRRRGPAAHATPPARSGRRARPRVPSTPSSWTRHARAPTGCTWRRRCGHAAGSSTSPAIRRPSAATRARLAAGGFRLTGAVALDLMPQTFHVEVVATFERIAG